MKEIFQRYTCDYCHKEIKDGTMVVVNLEGTDREKHIHNDCFNQIARSLRFMNIGYLHDEAFEKVKIER